MVSGCQTAMVIAALTLPVRGRSRHDGQIMDRNLIEEWLTPLQRLLIAYARKADKMRYAAAFALDNRLAESALGASEPLLGQVRIAWWRDRLADIDKAGDSGEPLLALFHDLEGQGTDLSAASGLVDHWEAVLLGDDGDDTVSLATALDGRGEALFALAGQCGEADPVQRQWAAHWSRWDWLRRLQEDRAETLWQQWRSDITQPPRKVFDRAARPLSMLCRLVYADRDRARPGSDIYRPAIAGKLIWHGLTGR